TYLPKTGASPCPAGRIPKQYWKRMGRTISLALFACAAAVAPAQVLDSRMHHLRSGDETEWQEFEGRTPEGKSLDFHFQAQTNKEPMTLFIRQVDVKVVWNV